MIYFLWGLIDLCLVFACVTDLKSCQVMNITWWISGVAAMLLYPFSGDYPETEQVIGLVIFLALQFFLFARWYGKADCYAFSVCALAEGSQGVGLLEFLLQMLLAFLLLAVVQGWKKNINSQGNLKHPVPFLPYITLAFWGMLWYHNSC